MAGKGGRNPGAGRPPGSAWKPVVRALRVETVMQMQRIVEADRNPLTVLVDWVLDEGMDIQARLSAASIVMPYLFPRLSQTTVDSRHTVVKVDAAEVLDRLSARIERLAAPAVIDAEAAPELPTVRGGAARALNPS
jgi:hypothetical protein